jgi:PAS domain S-box-containing protein
MKEQLRISKNQLRHVNHGHYDISPLPSTMPQALEEHRQAIVVTEATPPFQIVHVNDVWTGLCGWSMDECRGKTLSLLQGRETELSAVTSLMNQLLRGEEGGVILTNYTKEGRRFRNHLRVGPCDGLFVGVLQEIHDEN